MALDTAQSRNAVYIALNVASSIGIVIVNKLLFNKYAFPFGTFLTLIHFIFTTVSLRIFARMGIFEMRHIAWRDVVALSASFCGFVVLTNLSLVHNSVGFYQLAKVMTTPTIVVIQMMSYNMAFSNRVKGSLLAVCIGVVIASVTDVELNGVGTMYAVGGILATAYYQIWVGTRQKELNVNSMQLLAYQAPLSCLVLLPLVPLIEDVSALYRVEWTSELVVLITLTGLLSVAVNISIFLIIGRTSPVTYNVVGHFKTCCVLFLGFVIFNYQLDVRNIAGILITLGGVISYTQYKLQETAKASRLVSATATPVLPVATSAAKSGPTRD